MKPPRDTDLFFIDRAHGNHYHVPGCVAVTNPDGAYKLLSYGEIRSIAAHDGHPFQPDLCVLRQHGETRDTSSDNRFRWSRNPLTVLNATDDNGNPTGGTVSGVGLSVSWQGGPLGRPPKPATGAFVEDVIEAARQRLTFYQEASGGKFACRENALAITKLEECLHWLYTRRMERESRGVQGEHKP